MWTKRPRLERSNVADRAISGSKWDFPKNRIVEADAQSDRVAATTEPFVEADGETCGRTLLRKVRCTGRRRSITCPSPNERVVGPHEVKTKTVGWVDGSSANAEISADFETTNGQASRRVLEHNRSPLIHKVTRNLNIFVTCNRILILAAECGQPEQVSCGGVDISHFGDPESVQDWIVVKVRIDDNGLTIRNGRCHP